MRKFFLLALPVFLLLQAQAATFPLPRNVDDSTQVLLPVEPGRKSISLAALSVINIKDFETLRGKKLSFFEKIAFKLEQQKLRNYIDDNGTYNTNAQQTVRSEKADDGKSGFHFGGFVLGFLGLLPGVLVAYLINDEKKLNRIKWAWIGFSIPAIIILLLVAVSGGL